MEEEEIFLLLTCTHAHAAGEERISPRDGDFCCEREREREGEREKRMNFLIAPLLAMEKFPSREDASRERKRERGVARDEKLSYPSPHDGNNFRHEKMRGEREKAQEGEGEEGRRIGRKGGEEIDTGERKKGARDIIVFVAREKGGMRTRVRAREKEGGRDSERQRKNEEGKERRKKRWTVGERESERAGGRTGD